MVFQMHASKIGALKKAASDRRIISFQQEGCGQPILWQNEHGCAGDLASAWNDLPYEDRDVINDPLQRQEMIMKSGQMLSPCVEVDGHMLPDISGDEVEAYMLSKGLIQPNEAAPDAP